MPEHQYSVIKAIAHFDTLTEGIFWTKTAIIFPLSLKFNPWCHVTLFGGYCLSSNVLLCLSLKCWRCSVFCQDFSLPQRKLNMHEEEIRDIVTVILRYGYLSSRDFIPSKGADCFVLLTKYFISRDSIGGHLLLLMTSSWPCNRFPMFSVWR